jgi:hypothetical protein
VWYHVSKATVNFHRVLLNLVTYLSVGTEIYQEYLVKALAKYFGARLVIIDSSMLFGVRPCTILY